MVFYRKYRPQTIEELDSREVREKLISVLSKDSVHAMLFTGPKGLGKTSTARIVAKIINCEKITEKDREKGILVPCNKCESCVSITNGNNIDILEIDGASNRGIDEIRDLREKIRLSPARARKKVYIIDEVHMLTTEAFNALLKTLEEPPSHVVFILCTTEPHKVPATIASRCFHISFKRATNEELIRAFERIVKNEKIGVDKEALLEIAKLSDGSFRDGVKALEELAATAGGKKITSEFVQKTFQTGGLEKVSEEMINFLINKDIKKSISLIGDLVKEGRDLKHFWEYLISKLHDILLGEIGVVDKSKFSGKISVDELKDLIELLSSAIPKMKFSVLPQLPLEITVIDWSVKDPSFPHAEGDARKGYVKPEIDSRSLSESRQQADPNNSSGHKPTFSSPSDGKSSILNDLINSVKTKNHSIAGFLRGCRVKEHKNGKLVLEAPKFHRDNLTSPKSMDIIEDALKEITGKKTSVDFVLKS